VGFGLLLRSDDPEAVVRVCNLAVQWRQRYKQDVVVDIVCRRGLGETEAPMKIGAVPLSLAMIGFQGKTIPHWFAVVSFWFGLLLFCSSVPIILEMAAV
jgi:hypothetical protein